jgi:putative glutamine amidotransferase
MVSHHNNVEEFAQLYDGLLLPGGIDLDPTFYGENNIASFKVDPQKDDFERRLMHAFIGAGKPIFGICRGFQMIFRELIRDDLRLEEWFLYYQHMDSHNQTGELNLERDVRCHEVNYLPNRLYGTGGNKIVSMFTNSMHHQAIWCIPPTKKPNATIFLNVQVVATTRHGLKSKTKGYIVEGIRCQWGESDILAVQWHPEELNDTALISNFFEPTITGETEANGA